MVLEDEELGPSSSRVPGPIDIDMFVPRDRSSGSVRQAAYLTPPIPSPRRLISVIREAMKSTGMVGISRLVLYRRERAVMLEPRDNGIVLWTLRYGDEVRPEDQYFADVKDEKVEPQLKSLVTKLIEERTKGWDPSIVRDPVQDG